MKRFYSEVTLAGSDADGWQVMLDGRAVKTQGGKTPDGTAQTVPRKALAEALAEEWAGQGDEIDPQSFPLRDMADYAIDIAAAERDELTAKLLSYGETDTLLYRADPDSALYIRQQEIWEPLVGDLEDELGARLVRVSGIMHARQDETAINALAARLADYDAFTLTALYNLTSLASSLIVGLAALKPDAPVAGLWTAANLEEIWQAEQWGEDSAARQRLEARWHGFAAAHKFAALARAA